MTKGLGFEPEQHVAVARITIDHETTEDPQYRDEINKKIAKKAVKDDQADALCCLELGMPHLSAMKTSSNRASSL